MTARTQPFTDRLPLLRRALQVDAALVAVSSVALLAGAQALEPLLGIPASFLFGAGLLLLPYTAFLAYAATRAEINRRAAWGVAIFNVLWVVDSIVLLASGVLPLTQAGFWFVVAQAVAVDLIAVAQYLGQRRTA